MEKTLEDLKRDLELLEEYDSSSYEEVIKKVKKDGTVLTFDSIYDFLEYLSKEYKDFYREFKYVIDDIHDWLSVVSVCWTDLEGNLDRFYCTVQTN